MIIEISSLIDVYNNIKPHHTIILNKQGTIYTLGIRGVDRLFYMAKQAFPNIATTVLLIENSTAAFFTAMILNYTNIIYTGNLQSISDIADKHKIKLYSNLQEYITSLNN